MMDVERYYNEERRKAMSGRSAAALSTNVQQAVRWIGEVMKANPKTRRNQVINDAQLRFDLTPTECEFLNHNFKEPASGRERGNG